MLFPSQLVAYNGHTTGRVAFVTTDLFMNIVYLNNFNLTHVLDPDSIESVLIHYQMLYLFLSIFEVGFPFSLDLLDFMHNLAKSALWARLCCTRCSQFYDGRVGLVGLASFQIEFQLKLRTVGMCWVPTSTGSKAKPIWGKVFSFLMIKMSWHKACCSKTIIKDLFKSVWVRFYTFKLLQMSIFLISN